MRPYLYAIAAAFAALNTGPASAASVLDPIGDFLPSFTGAHRADLDVTGFSVNFNPVTSMFTIGATLAGIINPARPGFYVIGVNTGAGAIRPFAGIGQPNVIFDQAFVIRKDGTGSLGPNPQPAGSLTLLGNQFIVSLNASLFPSTGFTPDRYGFNLWPRIAFTGNADISDFAPNNATLASAVPEPALWGMLILGFGAIGGTMRRRQAASPVFKSLPSRQ